MFMVVSDSLCGEFLVCNFIWRVCDSRTLLAYAVCFRAYIVWVDCFKWTIVTHSSIRT